MLGASGMKGLVGVRAVGGDGARKTYAHSGGCELLERNGWY